MSSAYVHARAVETRYVSLRTTSRIGHTPGSYCALVSFSRRNDLAEWSCCVSASDITSSTLFLLSTHLHLQRHLRSEGGAECRRSHEQALLGQKMQAASAKKQAASTANGQQAQQMNGQGQAPNVGEPRLSAASFTLESSGGHVRADSGSSVYDSDAAVRSAVHSAQVTPAPAPAPSLASA